jgi:hypothetical protein
MILGFNKENLSCDKPYKTSLIFQFSPDKSFLKEVINKLDAIPLNKFTQIQ